jgi:hypothetical protein
MADRTKKTLAKKRKSKEAKERRKVGKRWVGNKTKVYLLSVRNPLGRIMQCWPLTEKSETISSFLGVSPPPPHFTNSFSLENYQDS